MKDVWVQVIVDLTWMLELYYLKKQKVVYNWFPLENSMNLDKLNLIYFWSKVLTSFCQSNKYFVYYYRTTGCTLKFNIDNSAIQLSNYGQEMNEMFE